MNNLKKFETEAAYSAATLNYPAVSWVVSGDTVHYDLSGSTPPTPTNDKVIIASYDGEGEGCFTFYNCGSSGVDSEIVGLTLDDVEVNPVTCITEDNYDASEVHIAIYTLDDGRTQIMDWCSGDIGVGGGSNPSKVDVLIPSQITDIYNMPMNSYNWVIEATTPPYVEALNSMFRYNGYIYVPDSAVNDYKSDSNWGDVAEYILPISNYSGNLPI